MISSFHISPEVKIGTQENYIFIICRKYIVICSASETLCVHSGYINKYRYEKLNKGFVTEKDSELCQLI